MQAVLFFIFSVVAQILSQKHSVRRDRPHASDCGLKAGPCERPAVMFIKNSQQDNPGAEVTLVETLTGARQTLLFRKIGLKLLSLKGATLRFGFKERTYDWTDIFAREIVQLFARIHEIRTLEVIGPSSSSLIEKLERNEIDVVAVLQPLQKCLLLPSRAKATHPVQVARPVALLLEDVGGGDVFVSLLWTSWGAKLVTTLVLCVAAFRLSSTVHWWLRPDHHAWTLSDMLLWAIAAIAQQGYTKHPKGLSCRAMFALGYLMANLMYTAFAAAVCSLLATAADTPEWKFRQPIDWETLQVQGKVTADARLANFFFGKWMDLVPDTETGVTSVLSKQMAAALTDDVEAARVIKSAAVSSAACQLRVAPLTGTTAPLPTFIPYSLVISRYSAPAALFDDWLLRLRESGLLKRLVDVEVGGAACDRSPLGGGFLSADLHHVGSALNIYLSGLAASVMLLLGEIITVSGWFTSLLNRIGRSAEVQKKAPQKNGKEEELPWPILA